MGIKVSYIILKTFTLAKNCHIYAVSGFDFNDNNPIKANKHFSFVLENSKIKLKKIEPVELKLPNTLLNLNKSDDILPSYNIEAV
ncbi:N6-L-threonylcarbamoyladenine synthase, TsaB subunit [Campylobacter blaseri]|nr:glycoprotease [Campylobacter blaseri]QKF86665.1 N6-L-threonylcarbamoyladenine synthase, TsaB subunit [Campylobacter blaseri]